MEREDEDVGFFKKLGKKIGDCLFCKKKKKTMDDWKGLKEKDD